MPATLAEGVAGNDWSIVFGPQTDAGVTVTTDNTNKRITVLSNAAVRSLNSLRDGINAVYSGAAVITTTGGQSGARTVNPSAGPFQFGGGAPATTAPTAEIDEANKRVTIKYLNTDPQQDLLDSLNDFELTNSKLLVAPVAGTTLTTSPEANTTDDRAFTEFFAQGEDPDADPQGDQRISGNWLRDGDVLQLQLSPGNRIDIRTPPELQERIAGYPVAAPADADFIPFIDTSDSNRGKTVSLVNFIARIRSGMALATDSAKGLLSAAQKRLLDSLKDEVNLRQRGDDFRSVSIATGSALETRLTTQATSDQPLVMVATEDIDHTIGSTRYQYSDGDVVVFAPRSSSGKVWFNLGAGGGGGGGLDPEDAQKLNRYPEQPAMAGGARFADIEALNTYRFLIYNQTNFNADNISEGNMMLSPVNGGIANLKIGLYANDIDLVTFTGLADGVSNLTIREPDGTLVWTSAIIGSSVSGSVLTIILSQSSSQSAPRTDPLTLSFSGKIKRYVDDEFQDQRNRTQLGDEITGYRVSTGAQLIAALTGHSTSGSARLIFAQADISQRFAGSDYSFSAGDLAYFPPRVLTEFLWFNLVAAVPDAGLNTAKTRIETKGLLTDNIWSVITGAHIFTAERVNSLASLNTAIANIGRLNSTGWLYFESEVVRSGRTYAAGTYAIIPAHTSLIIPIILPADLGGGDTSALEGKVTAIEENGWVTVARQEKLLQVADLHILVTPKIREATSGAYTILFTNSSVVDTRGTFYQVGINGALVQARRAWDQPASITVTPTAQQLAAINRVSTTQVSVSVEFYREASGGAGAGSVVDVVPVEAPPLADRILQAAVAGSDTAGTASITLPTGYNSHKRLAMAMWAIQNNAVNEVEIHTDFLMAQTANINIILTTRNNGNVVTGVWNPNNRTLTVTGTGNQGARILYAALTD